MPVAATSLAAYAKGREKHPTQRERVFRCIVANPNLSREQIADRLGLKVSSVCGRCNELIASKMVKENGRIDGANRLVAVSDSALQAALF